MSTARPHTRLEEIMQAEGRKQSWLAGQVGADPSTISKVLRGFIPSEAMREAIADALRRDVDDVFPQAVGLGGQPR